MMNHPDKPRAGATHRESTSSNRFWFLGRCETFASKRRFLTLTLALAVWALGSGQAATGPADDPPPITAAEPAGRSEGLPWHRWPVATGDWGGVRERMVARGVSIFGRYTFDASTLLSGGTRDRWVGRGLVDLGVLFDLERLAGVRGAYAFFGVHSWRGRNGSNDTSDFQGYSNIDAEDFFDFAELWYEQRWLAERFRIKLGRIDGNTEFAYIDAAEEFINSSAGLSPTLFCMPTYPEPRLGVSFAARPIPRLRLAGGVFDSPLNDDPLNRNDQALFAVGEASLYWSGRNGWSAGRVAVGTWRDNGTVERFDGAVRRGVGGAYALVENGFRLRRAGDWLPELKLFGQLSTADPEVSEVARHWMIGLAAFGPIALRETDTAGLLVSRVELSDAPNTFSDRDETVFELFYGFRITSFVLLKPDLQFVVNPGGADVAPAWVGTVRVEILF